MRAHDPGATVVVVPSDHLIVEEALFRGDVTAVARFVQQHPPCMVLLGAQPTEPEFGGLRWAPGGLDDGGPVYQVCRFWRSRWRRWRRRCS
jgi:mannose-1-phosphate guanylyltransferase